MVRDFDEKDREGKRWENCFSCGHQDAAPMAEATFPLNAPADFACLEQDAVFCFAAVLGTWNILHANTYGLPLLMRKGRAELQDELYC